jgi:HD-GYP domain-containing protein (c-di-GMP phosphodiesterase class II)
VDAADVLLYLPYSQTLEYAASRGFRTSLAHGASIRLGEGLAGQAALERRLVQVPNLGSAEDNSTSAQKFSRDRFVSYMGMPLLAKGQVLGVLEIFHRSPLQPDGDWLDFMETLASQAAIALDNARLFQDLQKSNADLSRAYDTTLDGWSRALDLRDKETEGHSARVTDMTLRLARLMGFGEEQLTHVRRGALLHHTSKMGIPDSILLKPGSLDGNE